VSQAKAHATDGYCRVKDFILCLVLAAQVGRLVDYVREKEELLGQRKLFNPSSASLIAMLTLPGKDFRLLCALMVAGAASRSPRQEPRGPNLQIDFGVVCLRLDRGTSAAFTPGSFW
jgi:hypothetical protein